MADTESMLKGDLRRAIQELYFWQRVEDASNFTALLFRLISKADIVNRGKLSGAFPAEYNAFMLWQDSPDEDAFFRQWLGEDIPTKKMP